MISRLEWWNIKDNYDLHSGVSVIGKSQCQLQPCLALSVSSQMNAAIFLPGKPFRVNVSNFGPADVNWRKIFGQNLNKKKIFGKLCSVLSVSSLALLSPACNGVACDALEGILYPLSSLLPTAWLTSGIYFYQDLGSSWCCFPPWCSVAPWECCCWWMLWLVVLVRQSWV